MCNINIIMSLKKIKSAKITECMNVVSFNSFLHNKDAEGHYCEDFVVKRSLNKQILKGKHSLIVSHQRISTSGKVPEMTQPLETKNFILTHNGVLSDLGNLQESDTWQYLLKLEEYYAMCKDTVKSIQKLNKETGGGYSMVLYNKNTKEFLYYKSHSTSMYIAQSKSILMMSTSQENVIYMQKYFDQACDIIDVDHEKIFDINDGFKEIATFETKSYNTGICNHQSNGVFNRRGRYSRNSNRQAPSRHTPPMEEDRETIIEALELSGYQDVSCGIHSQFCIIGVWEKDGNSFGSLFTKGVTEMKPKGGKRRFRVPIEELTKFSDDLLEAIKENSNNTVYK